MSKKKISFRKIFSVSIGTIAATAMVTSLATSCASENVVYEFDGKKFNSKKDIEDYAKNNLTTQVGKDSSNNDYWLVNNNGVNEKFNDPYYLKQMIQSGIQTVPVSSSLNVNKYINSTTDSIGVIPNTLVGKLLSNNDNKANTNNKLVNIYRGRNSKYYYSEQEAKQSYLNVHNAYYFNNVYFSNKEALNVYLTNNYDENNNSFNFVDSQYKSLKAPNGFTSQPLEYSDDVNQNKNNAVLKKDVKNFVEKNAKNVYAIKDSQGVNTFTSGASSYELSKKLTIENTDPVIMYNNEGRGSYIVDTSAADEYNFYGPYFYKGSADILNITDKKLWKEVDQSDRDVLNQNREDSFIQSFFGMLVKDIQNDEELFSIDELNSDTQNYSSFMQTNYPAIWANVLETKGTLELGKRFNSFLKIPVMYTYIVEQLVLNGANNIAITKTKNYFKKICDFYDSVMRAMIPSVFLKPSDGTADDDTVGEDGLLSFSKLFGFDIKGFNYNSNINYYMDKIKLHYRNILPLATVSMLGYQNASILDGGFEFEANLIAQQVKNYDSSLNKDYEYVWNIFSCNTLDKIKDFYTKNQSKIKLTLDKFIEFSSGYVQRNALFYQCLQVEFQDQLKEYLADKTKQSKLSMFKDVKNLDKLLSKVGNSFPLFTIFKNLPMFGAKLKDGISSLFGNALFNSLKTVDANLVKDSSNYTDFIIPGLEENYKLVFKVNAHFISNTNFEWYLDGTNSANKNVNEAILNKILEIGTKSIDVMKDFYEGLEDIVKLSKKTKEIVDKGAKALEKLGTSLSKITGMITKFVKFFSVVGVALECLQFILDAFMPKDEPKSYIYESDGTQYIWDGGLKSSIFFGLVESDVRTIDSMKLLDPIKLNEPRARDFYYLNGKNYTPTVQDETYLSEYAKALSNGEVESDNIKLLYSFDNATYAASKTIPQGLYEDKDSLSDEVFNSAFVKNESKYTNSEITYKYANGKTAISTGSDSKDMLIQNLIDNIEPTKIAMLPNLDQYNYPVKRDDELPDQSINSYVLPGTSYDMKTGKEVSYESKDKNNKFRYVIVDPNQEKTGNKTNASISVDAEKELINKFMDSFNVESKIVYERETIGNDYFTDFSSQANLFNLYKAENEIGESKYFLSIENAFQWLLSNYQYKKITSNKEITYYVYDGKEKFYSMEDFYKWISKNTVEVRR